MENTKNPFRALSEIQNKLVARKDLDNKFGNYKYRSCESILAALKPLLATYDYSVVFRDDIIAVCDRVYVRAECILIDDNGNEAISSVGWAREALVKKGMDDSQCTGSASSYARKYALCGMFAIDDSSVDPDKTNDHKDGSPLTSEDIAMMRGASTKESLAELCKTLVDEGKSRTEITKHYREAMKNIGKEAV